MADNQCAIDLNATYTHRRKSGRYKVFCIPLSSGQLREEKRETIVYHDLETLRWFVRDKWEFLEKMIVLK